MSPVVFFFLARLLLIPFLFCKTAFSMEHSAPLLDSALGHVAMTRDDVRIRPDLLKSPNVSALCASWMQNPLAAPREGQELGAALLSLMEDPHEWLATLPLLLGERTPPPPQPRTRSDWPIPGDLPGPLRPVVSQILDSMAHAQDLLEEALKGVTPEDLQSIRKYLYPEPLASDNQELLLEGLDVSKRIEKAIEVAQKIDRDLILKAGLCVVRDTWSCARELSRHPGGIEIRTPVVFETRLGTVRIGTSGPDTHQGPAALVIDPGGDDIYRGRVGAGENGSCGIVLDLSGNDLYVGGEITQGAGIAGGVGLLVDMQGDDIYKASNGCQGAGVFGLGLLVDVRGNDQYYAEQFVQAAAAWGYGGVLDLHGDDTYRCASQGQACSRLPGAAALCDLRGNDRYISGYDRPDPRDPDMHQSFSQGFAMGMRDLCAGGTAILADGGGNDLYHGQYFAQGSSYWLAVGLLVDLSGRDTYIARRYSQGAGIHISLGMLLDILGDDHTVSWGVSQGCGHDWGVGILVNETGNDSYVGDWLCMGASEANGIGIFTDNAGNDGYEIRSGAGTGRLTPSRRSGGLGLFMDSDGEDRYSQNGANNLFWGKNRWAVGVDGSSRVSGLNLEIEDPLLTMCEDRGTLKKKEQAELHERELRRILQLPLNDQVEKLLELSTHWGLDRKGPEKALELLLEIPGDISVPMLAAHLDKPGIMLHMRIQEVFQKHAHDALPVLLEKASDPDEEVRGKALLFLSMLRDTRAVDVCVDALNSPAARVRSYAVRALGEILEKKRLRALNPMKNAFLKARASGRAAPILEYLSDKESIQESLSVAIRAFPMDHIDYKRYSETGPDQKRRLDEYASLLLAHSEEMRHVLDKWTGDIEHPGHIADLLGPLTKASAPTIRANALYALGQMEEIRALSEMIEALLDPHALVRDSASLGLVFFGNAAVEEISRGLGQRPAPFLILALDVLARIDTPEGRRIIAQYLESKEPAVQRAAERALGHFLSVK